MPRSTAKRRASKSATAITTKRTQTEDDTGRGDDASVAAALTRSPVYRRVPVGERSRLDKAIILRPSGCATMDAIAAHFDLADKYGISRATLRTYAAKLEQLVRPALTSHLVAGILGCLPESYRRQIVQGGQVMLVSRVVAALEASDVALTAAELARLGSFLTSLAVGRTGYQPGRSRRSPTKSDAGGSVCESDEISQGPIKLAESVRLLYGLAWPPEAAEPPSQPAGAGSDADRGNRGPEAVPLGTEGSCHGNPDESTR